MYGIDKKEVYPLHISDAAEKREQDIDLLLVAGGGRKHYCWIKNMSRLLSGKISDHNGEIYLCRRCLNHFHNKENLAVHRESCANHKAVKIEMPAKGTSQTFANNANSMRVPFVVYADFECFTEKVEPKPAAAPEDKPYTKAYQKHTPSRFCYQIKCFDDSVKKPVLYTMRETGEDVA